jgi:outer membrane biosynthesis protein TonB
MMPSNKKNQIRKGNRMNKKIRTILAAGMILTTVLPVVACAKKTPVTNAVPTTVAVSIPETKLADKNEEETAKVMPVAVQQPEMNCDGSLVKSVASEPEPDETENTVTTAQKAAKKAAKKTAKKTSKKTTKKTKNTKTTKKTTKKVKSGKSTVSTTNKTAAPQFEYGHTEYTCKGFLIKVFIGRNNNVNATIVYKSEDRKDYRRELYYSMNGTIDPKTNKFTYGNCEMHELIYTELGLKSIKANYRKGTGYMTFSGDTLTWTDSMQHIADGFTFKMK